MPYCNPYLHDKLLDAIRQECNRMVLCSATPTNYTEANSTYALRQCDDDAVRFHAGKRRGKRPAGDCCRKEQRQCHNDRRSGRLRTAGYGQSTLAVLRG